MRRQEEKFWKNLDDSVERLRDDSVAWQGYQKEIHFFEGGSMDGLEDEEPYYSPEEEGAIRADNDRTEGR